MKEKLGYVSSKEAWAILRKGTYAVSFWFDFGEEGMLVIDHIPENYPELELGFFFKDKEEAIGRIQEMLYEGWHIDQKSNEEVLEECVIPKQRKEGKKWEDHVPTI